MNAILIFLFSSFNAFAGYTELSGSVNYKKTSIDKYNYSDSTSYTASVSYYFWELSALELSYTSGLGKLSTKATGALEPVQIQIAQFSMTGLDLVLSLATREDVIQPYVKVGAAYMDKQFFKETELEGTVRLQSQYGIVPSAGVGMKVGLTKTLSIRLGIDAWTSPLSDKSKDSSTGEDRKTTIDYAGRAGLSWVL